MDKNEQKEQNRENQEAEKSPEEKTAEQYRQERLPKKKNPHSIALLVLFIAAAGAYVTFVFSYCGHIVCRSVQSEQALGQQDNPASVPIQVPENVMPTSTIPSTISAVPSSQNMLKIGDTVISVEFATTTEAQETGLSYRSSLAQNAGMWFVLATSSYQGMWMKAMNFPLDIIWFDQNMRVIDIAKNLSPSTYPEIFQPASLASYVLEVNAGFADQHGVEIGDTVSFQ